MTALRRCGATLLLRRRGALHSAVALSAADKRAGGASSWDAAALSDRGAQRKAEYDNAPISSAGAPPPEVLPDQLKTWERRQGGTAHAFPGARPAARELRASCAAYARCRLTRPLRADWIERWSRKAFFRTGYVALAVTGGAVAFVEPHSAPTLLAMLLPVAAYWSIGLRDINQTRHTVR
jgi:hypothetical protein